MSVIKESCDQVIGELKKSKLEKKHLNVLRNIFDKISKKEKDGEIAIDRDREEDRDRRDDRKSDTDSRSDIGPSIIGGIERIVSEIASKGDYNYFPSDEPMDCREICIVFAKGNWRFGPSNPLTVSVLSYWYRCFDTNKFTVIFSQSWQESSFMSFKNYIESYEAGGPHSVVFLEFDAFKGLTLKYPR